jgi:hypothetical protein
MTVAPYTRARVIVKKGASQRESVTLECNVQLGDRGVTGGRDRQLTNEERNG